MKRENTNPGGTAQLRLPELHVGRGVDCGSVTVFPIWTDANAVTGINWVGRGLVIDEVDGGSVPHLRVTNPTDEPQLILEGDILEGGRQDRMSAQTLLVLPGETVIIPVNCVEAGRWNSGRGHRPTNLKSSYSVREARRRAFSSGGNAQGAVWSRIDYLQSNLGETSSTRNFKENASRRGERIKAVKERMERGEQIQQDDELFSELNHPAMLKPLDGQRGVIISIGGKIIAAEVFATAEAFAERWDGLAIAAEIDGRTARPVKANAHAARMFAQRISGALVPADRHGRFEFGFDGIAVNGVMSTDESRTVLQFTAANENESLLVG